MIVTKESRIIVTEKKTGITYQVNGFYFNGKNLITVGGMNCGGATRLKLKAAEYTVEVI